ncbi:WG repeat-containing protein [Sphingomonas sp. HF-S3]|uniref:WG repeat-containing protein n=1 Tax=Sphingomonas rustica TaxID=3103142 RepID=A0ABV0B7N6_9SPHN
MLLISILMLSVAADTEPARYDLDCHRWTSNGDEMIVTRNCAAKAPDGSVRIARAVLKDLRFDPRTGLAEVGVKGWYYVRRDGQSARVMTWDNMPDPFNSGLARSPRGDKIGYVDTALKLAIPAQFDGALPFRDGRATVCFGCTIVQDGEHERYEGGRWACIDTRGRERPPTAMLNSGYPNCS